MWKLKTKFCEIAQSLRECLKSIFPSNLIEKCSILTNVAILINLAISFSLYLCIFWPVCFGGRGLPYWVCKQKLISLLYNPNCFPTMSLFHQYILAGWSHHWSPHHHFSIILSIQSGPTSSRASSWKPSSCPLFFQHLLTQQRSSKESQNAQDILRRFLVPTTSLLQMCKRGQPDREEGFLKVTQLVNDRV